jgi:hypothetical protein
MTAVAWPHPGDTALQRARRIALAYRQHLRVANRTLADALDEAAVAYGETWVAEEVVTVGPDEKVSTAAAAALAGVTAETVRQWRKRGYMANGVRVWLARAGLDERGWPLFRAADVLAAAAATRQTRTNRAVT